MKNRAVHLLGIPFNSAGTPNGVAGAPQALRQAGLVAALEGAGRVVVDAGDVSLVYEGPRRDRASGVIAPEVLASMIRDSRAAVSQMLRAGGWPLVIGGDCPVLIGCLGASSEPPGVLFLDGHEDAWPPSSSTTGEAADMELGLLLGQSLQGLPEQIVREIPRLSPDSVIVIGARDGAELAAAGISSLTSTVKLVSPEEAARQPAEIGRACAQTLAASGPWWLHVDLDVLSTDSLAAVDYQQPGGLSWAELTTLTKSAVQLDRLIGMDVTIYNPDLDPSGAGGGRIVQYLADVLGA